MHSSVLTVCMVRATCAQPPQFVMTSIPKPIQYSVFQTRIRSTNSRMVSDGRARARVYKPLVTHAQHIPLLWLLCGVTPSSPSLHRSKSQTALYDFILSTHLHVLSNKGQRLRTINQAQKKTKLTPSNISRFKHQRLERSIIPLS